MAVTDFAPGLVTDTTVDRRVYTDLGIYRQEMQRIFRGGWVYVGLEVEIPRPGDFKTTRVGDVPVIVSRGQDGRVHVVENSCSHRGAKVARQLYGTCTNFQCLYHQWTFAPDGRLLGVPHRQQFGDRLDKPALGLARMRVETFSGMVFASLDAGVESLGDYLGEAAPHLEELLYGGDLAIAGFQNFQIKANWKLFYENTQDAYHALLLHDFIADMGIVSSGQNIDFGNGHGVIMWQIPPLTTEMISAHLATQRFQLREFSMFTSDDRPAGALNRVMGIFPNALVLEEWDQMNVRQIVPTGPGSMDVFTIALGRSGDSPEKLASRARKFGHLFGPAGFAGLDDITACQVVQETHSAPGRPRALMAMGDVEGTTGGFDSEVTVRGFYRAYRARMGAAAPRPPAAEES